MDMSEVCFVINLFVECLLYALIGHSFCCQYIFQDINYYTTVVFRCICVACTYNLYFPVRSLNYDLEVHSCYVFEVLLQSGLRYARLIC
jgi:hypothetical protein